MTLAMVDVASLTKKQNDALRIGERLACSIAAKRAGNKRFVVLSPFKDKGAREEGYAKLPWRFRVARYEIRAELLEGHTSRSMAEDYEDRVVESLDEALRLMTKWAPSASFEPNGEVGAPF